MNYKKEKKRMRKIFKQAIESLSSMEKSPDKYRLLSWEYTRDAVEDPLETYLHDNRWLCKKAGPIIEINLKIAIKDN